MAVQFKSFEEWRTECEEQSLALWEPVMAFEKNQRGTSEEEIWAGLDRAYQVMKEAVTTGLTEEMNSYSGMIKGGAKKVINNKTVVLSAEFQKLIARALAAKEVNSCMGRVVAGTASSQHAIDSGKRARPMAEAGWRQVEKILRG